LRQQLHDHPVLVVRGVDGADLAGTVRVIQRRFYLIHIDSEGRGAITVDGHLHLGIFDLQIAGDIGEARDVVEPLLQRRRATVERIDVGALQGELVEALRGPPTNVDHRRVLDESSDSRHGRELPRE
jgi:hypothetical protein